MQKPHARFIKIDVTTPLIFTIYVIKGIINSIQDIHKLNLANDDALTHLKVNRWMMSPGTQRICLTMKKDGIYGTIFIPDGEGPFPGLY